MMPGKKQIWAIFLFKFKMNHKAAETTQNINKEFGSRTLNERTVQSWFLQRSLAKEMRALKVRSVVAGHWEMTMTNWEPSSKQILLQLHKKLPNNSTLVIRFVKQIGKVKKLNK